MPKIAIAGFGMEGRATYAYLKGAAELHVFDEQEVDMAGIDAPFHLGLSIPADFAVVYKTPGIPDSKLKVQSPDTRVTTLMDDVLAKVGRHAIGVTGTKGKSTVTSLVHHILAESGKKSVLFGNIGIANMALVQGASEESIFVLELSSYQCEHLTHSPHVAVLTNFYPEHLTHHGSLERYREAKLNIARFQSHGDVFINGSDVVTDFRGTVITPQSGNTFETKLIGAHNQYNCALALIAVQAFDVSEEEARKHIATFEPLPYRIEHIGEYRGITFYDDSLASIPQATIATIRALGNVDTIILGGQDRGIPFRQFADDLKETSIKTFITFPDTGTKMVAKVQDRTIVPVTTMEEAVRAVFEHTAKGGVAILSTASPSYNLFKDYKDRSAQYRDWIKKLA